MKPWTIITVFLAGCSALPERKADVLPPMSVSELSQKVAEMELGCGLPIGSLLHPASHGRLEVWSAEPSKLTYSQFRCVMAAVEDAQLERRGVKLVLMGEDSP